jgi:beta-glucosidase
VKELKSFAKSRLLQPGESQTLKMLIPAGSLASWNEAVHQWQTDPGTYLIQVGASSADIKLKQSVKL